MCECECVCVSQSELQGWLRQSECVCCVVFGCVLLLGASESWDLLPTKMCVCGGFFDEGDYILCRVGSLVFGKLLRGPCYYFLQLLLLLLLSHFSRVQLCATP